MGDNINLTLDTRTVQGKKVARLRQEGLVPSVVYGQGFEPLLGQAPYGVLEKVVRDAGKSTPVHLTVAGKKKIALIKSVDRDPVKARIRHVSFHAVKQNEIVTVEVGIRLVGEGESEAERAGLVVLQAIETVEVKAKPADLPDVLEVPITTLKTTDDKITLGDITLPKGVEFADADQDRELVVANVYEPAALEAANDATGGDAEADAEDVPADNGEAEAAPAASEE